MDGILKFISVFTDLFILNLERRLLADRTGHIEIQSD